MAISSILLICFRVLELLITIPIIGMLAYFVHGYVVSNQLTPTYILVLFICSVLAGAWALFTLFHYLRSRDSALFVALIDLAFVATFIAGVYELRGIASANCTNFTAGSFYFNLGPFGYYGRQGGSSWSLNTNKTCAMLKASFALGIIDILLFFITFLLALLASRHYGRDNRTVVKREYHTSRHGHRSSSGRSARGSYDNRDRPSSSRRSHHSTTRRSYYV